METKPFYKTSEFWGIILANVAAFATSISGYLPPAWLPFITAGTAAFYAISRGMAKSGVAPKEEEKKVIP